MTKRRYFTRIINGRVFTYDSKPAPAPVQDRYSYGHNIFNAYDRPSSIKVNIWEDWWLWLLDICKVTSDYSNNDIWIDTRNCFMFTISGTIINPDTGELMGIHITRDNNYCWSIGD